MNNNYVLAALQVVSFLSLKHMFAAIHPDDPAFSVEQHILPFLKTSTRGKACEQFCDPKVNRKRIKNYRPYSKIAADLINILLYAYKLALMTSF